VVCAHAQSVDCPECCADRTTVYVPPNYYLPSERPLDALTNVSNASAHFFDLTTSRCPMPAMCLGGDATVRNGTGPLIAGQTMCKQGSYGPLCGVCVPGYYRNQDECRLCPDAQVCAADSTISRPEHVCVWLRVAPN